MRHPLFNEWMNCNLQVVIGEKKPFSAMPIFIWIYLNNCFHVSCKHYQADFCPNSPKKLVRINQSEAWIYDNWPNTGLQCLINFVSELSWGLRTTETFKSPKSTSGTEDTDTFCSFFKTWESSFNSGGSLN